MGDVGAIDPILKLLEALGTSSPIVGWLAYMWWSVKGERDDVLRRLHEANEARLADLREAGRQQAATVERYAELAAGQIANGDAIIKMLERQPGCRHG
ncbi:hypothetical protein [Falsirhodobacter sp. 20TX0035]|uniref:hypothetical protein n=1 Tax=Falsirhodobacter sp. 20TX0035 TaxID=3022019 RepID=UPI00232AE331|nr:hypothetical protein [Falsirhodobacter sp. 20TX0035]MDB6454845.1 hypothetical protein [Falsirhodobacter sp. 20TX0035]